MELRRARVRINSYDQIPMMKSTPPSFQDMILTLHHYWSERGCVILQPYDMEVGAGTFHWATALKALGS